VGLEGVDKFLALLEEMAARLSEAQLTKVAGGVKPAAVMGQAEGVGARCARHHGGGGRPSSATLAELDGAAAPVTH